LKKSGLRKSELTMDTSIKIPFYAKIALISISSLAFIFTMHIAQGIIMPIAYATIIAILLNPLVNFLQRRSINRIVAISIAVTLTIVIVLGVFYIISSQLTMFSESWPQLKQKFHTTSTEFVHWISDKLNIRVSRINAWTRETQNEAINNFAIGDTLADVGGILVVFMLLPVYLFMILYYKPLLLEFIRRLFRDEHQVTVTSVLTSSKSVIQTYLVGLFFELVIVAILNAAGLLLLGIEYAIILGVIGAILNLIPYIGGIIAIALPMVIAFVTKDSLTYPILVFFVYLFIQFVDNNFIVPKIVAARVKINALMSVIVVLIGGALWGISGMFLSIPITAILKVIFDHIESLKAWGFLLGDIVPTAPKFSLVRKGKMPPPSEGN
jgi:predicted PurR-regulated permease PerM